MSSDKNMTFSFHIIPSPIRVGAGALSLPTSLYTHPSSRAVKEQKTELDVPPRRKEEKLSHPSQSK